MSGHSCPISSSWNTFCFHPPCYLLYTLPVNRGRLSNFLFINSVLSHCFLLKGFATTAAKLLLSDSLQSYGPKPITLLSPWARIWNGLPFPPPEDPPNPGIEPMSLLSPELAGGFFTTSATWGNPAGWDSPNVPAFQKTPPTPKFLPLEKEDFGEGRSQISYF